MFRQTWITVLLLLPAAFAAGPVPAAGEGRDDLDKATETNLTAEKIGDLDEVVRLTESALEKGLDESDTAFAKILLASTLIRRARGKIKTLFVNVASMDDFRRRREALLADLEKALKLDPKQPQAYLMIAQLDLLPGGGGATEALKKLDKAIALAPEDVSAYEAKANLLAQLKKYDEALALLDRAEKIDPNSVALLLQRARVHSAQKKPDAALEDLDKALALQPENAMVLLLRAGIYQETGQKEKALADVDKVLELSPGLIAAIRARALLLAEDERFDEAIAELEKLRRHDPNDHLTLLQLGMLYSVDEQSDKAVEVFSTLLAAEPDLWQALRGRGDAYLNLGKHAEALADYEKALKLKSQDHGILNNLAWVLATSPDDKLRDGKRAIRLATEACEATEYKLAHILSTLAAAYAESGDFDSAVKWSTKAVELGDQEHGEAIKKELESYKAKKPWRELLSEEKAEEK